MRVYWLVIGILGVWRVTQLLHAEAGPWQVLVHLRALLTRLGFGEVLACFYCLSLWLSLPVALGLGESWPERILLWFALAGGAALIERITPGTTATAATYFEDAPGPAHDTPARALTEGNDDVQLR